MILRRRRLRVFGVVQGVGFRPFVASHAARLGLAGSVANVGGVVVIDVTGPASALEEFAAIVAEGPVGARVDGIESADSDLVRSRGACPPGQHAPDEGFVIADSIVVEGIRELPLERAPCASCLRDLVDGRRAGHAFVSCNDCGPRFTITTSLPWDRARTSMNGFALCERCRAEYADVDDRRCHSQTQCCPDCGPKLQSTIERAVTALGAGQIVAVKGIGGFHLAVDAGNDDAVRRLRQRKSRPDKPLAVMVKDLEMARVFAEVEAAEETALASPAAPIVIVRLHPHSGARLPRAPLRQKSGGPGGPSFATTLALAPSPAKTVGLMLPSSPLHHLLLRAFDGPLVMTSANRAEDPIVVDSVDLGDLGDVVVDHDRAIVHGVDDSVVRVVDGAARVWRRGRGLAPSTIELTQPSDDVVLAVGGHQRCTFALSDGDRAILSPHVGDLDGARAVDRLGAAIDAHEVLYGVRADVVACDAHADYASSVFADEFAAARGIDVVRVFHHHAHFAAVLAEHGHDGAAVGFVGDGSGYGGDGSFWGGEFFVGDAGAVVRAAHLPTIRLPGGEKAARQPWRSATAWLHKAGIDDDILRVPQADRALARQLIEQQTHAPLTSSLGRLFDAVACIVGLGEVVSFSGQAAVALEDACDDDDDGVYEFADVIGSVVGDRADVGRVAARFHNTIARWIADTTTGLCNSHGVDVVALSGGVFMNARLLTTTTRLLTARGLRVLSHVNVPTNDGGIALGQLTIAIAQRAARGGAARR